MADQVVVAAAMVAQITQALYPSGATQPSITADRVKVYQGWPEPDTLKPDIALGIVHVSVWPTATARSTSRGHPEWRDVSRTEPTIVAAISGTTVTLSGTVAPYQVVVLMVNGLVFTHVVQAGETLAQIASAIATAASATASGAAFTLSASARDIRVRIVTTGVAAKQVRREERVFQVTVWARSPVSRERVASAIDAAMSDVRRMALPDGSVAQIVPLPDIQNDDLQKQGVFRRDLRIRAEYPVVRTEQQYTIAVPTVVQSGGLSFDAQGQTRTIVY